LGGSWVELNGFIEVANGSLNIAFRVAGHAAIRVRGSMIWVKGDGRIEIAYGQVKLTPGISLHRAVKI
jgi:hypothetical protein